MNKELKNKIDIVLENLPPFGETKFRSMTYEQGIEEFAMWLLGEISDEEFEYSKK